FAVATFLTIAIVLVMRFTPGKAPPVRTVPYTDEELVREARALGQYFVAGGSFLVLGSLHAVLKNLPWTAEWLARAGYAGHLLRDLSNTAVTPRSGGTVMGTRP